MAPAAASAPACFCTLDVNTTGTKSAGLQQHSSGACPSPNFACTKEALEVEADGHSCYSRMAWLQSENGLTEAQACYRVSSLYGACARCMPELPCGDANTSVAAARCGLHGWR